MGFLEILLIAGGLAMDAFAVSLAAGAAGSRGLRAVFRLAFHFGLFQFLMPVLGWFTGQQVAASVGRLQDWAASGLLGLVGCRMIRSARATDDPERRQDPSRGLTLVALCFATSLDALAIGFSLAMLRINIWYPSAVIGVVTGLLSLLGVRLGGRLGTGFGWRMELLGGVILVLLAARVLLGHLLG